MKRYMDVNRYMDMKRFIVQTVILAILIQCPPVSAAQVEAGDDYTNAQCTECHEEMADDHVLSVHASIECLTCHTQAVEEEHEEIAAVDCRQCHALHDEKVIHDAHTRVTCKACHMKGGISTAGPDSESVIWSGAFRPGAALLPHQAVSFETDARCGNCHFRGNTLGASSMILPAKSILCMPCHVATFSVGDKTTLVSLFIFLVGMVGLGAVWFSGSIDKGAHRSGEKFKVKTRSAPGALFPDKFIRLLNALIADVLFLQRLFRLSPTRWIIHALIFFPFLFRFAFGLTALVLSIFLPDWPVTAAMLNKNHAMRAFLFDLTGLMVLAGSAASIIRRRNEQIVNIASLPEPTRGMPALLVLIVLVGFVLEGLRIAMTGWPDGAGWAFFGYGVSLLLKGMSGLTDTYGYVWYAHAILVGAFMALIPFTHMSHIITAPIALIINARSESKEYANKEI
jgi:nitrate reductase gamma subunit